MRKNQIDVHMGTAKLTAKETIEVTDEEGKTSTLTAKNIVVATGAHPFIIPGVEVDGQQAIEKVSANLLEVLK